MVEQNLTVLNEKVFSEIKSRTVLRRIIHSDEGLNHWTDLYEINDPKILCSGSCEAKARFLLYTHWHDNTVGLIPSCEEHSPQMYFELLNDRTAG